MNTHLPLHELFDRYELLFPEHEHLADLRRAYIDKDLNSIFRLMSEESINDIEDYRKAVVEQNIHSIFRLLTQEHVSNKIELEDLRKAIVEQNLHSLFRLVDFEDLRKAVTDHNLYSLFKLIEYPDLKKAILNDSQWSAFRVIDAIVHTQFTEALKSLYRNETEFVTDCFSRGQLESKKWLVDSLENLDVNLGNVFLCAGWYGTLATMIFESGTEVDKIRSFDIDSSVADIAKVFNKPWVMDDWKFQAVTDDIHDIDFNSHVFRVQRSDGSEVELMESPDTIINTSCEHIENFSDWYAKIPTGKIVILQSNNYYDIEEHINCVGSIEEFMQQAPMTSVLYSGERSLELYTRYMLIGVK